MPDPFPRCSWGHIPQAASVLVHWWYSCDLSCSLPGPAWVGKPPVSAPSGEPGWASCSRRDDEAVCFRWCWCSRGTLSQTLGAMQGSFQTDLINFNVGFVIVLCVCMPGHCLWTCLWIYRPVSGEFNMKTNLIRTPCPPDSDYRNPVNIAHILLMVIVIKGINFLWVVEGKLAPYIVADLGPSGQPTLPFRYIQNRHCMCNTTLRCVCINIVAVGKR